MCSWLDFLDGQPGILPETRILSDATILVILSIAAGGGLSGQRLVLRFDDKGNMSAALQQVAVTDE